VDGARRARAALWMFGMFGAIACNCSNWMWMGGMGRHNSTELTPDVRPKWLPICPRRCPNCRAATGAAAAERPKDCSLTADQRTPQQIRATLALHRSNAV